MKRNLLLLVSLIALLQFLLHLGAMDQYGFHQDELLYISLSKRLAFGYIETPPFIAFVGKISTMVFGESLIAYRIIPALCAGAIVHLTAMITYRLGGSYFAITIACFSIALSSAFLATGALFIPQVFDELFWLLCAYLLVRWTQNKNDQYLYLLGAVLGIGMLVKYTVIIYFTGLILGILIYPHSDRPLIKPAFWKSASIAAAIFLPHMLWQYQNGFPALHHYKVLRETQLTYLTRTDFLLQQLLVNGTGIFIWLPGLYYCFASPKLKSYRFLGIAFMFVMIILIILNGKPYYGFGVFPPIFAAGAVALETAIQRKIVRISVIYLLTLPNLLLAIIVLPYLPIENTAKVFAWTYKHLNLHFPLKWEDQKIHSVNQNYADMIGWEELALKTSRLYLSQPKADRHEMLIFADDYGEAGALDYYRNIYPLPPVVSLSSSFLLWAPRKIRSNKIIYITARPLPFLLGDQPNRYAQIENPYSRVKGMDIYLIADMNGFDTWYRNLRHRNLLLLHK